ncbi:HAD-like domain-containing protein, partial [Mycena polygramma]
IHSIRVIYFEMYGTLIDKESGIFAALQPLLKRSPHNFDRQEALSFYYESEAEVKRRTPGIRYGQILADAYDDVALRLGMTPLDSMESSGFAQSIKHWPLLPAADWCLSSLKRIPSISLVATADVDHDCLTQSAAFAVLAPFFEAVFTWDECKAYKPDPAAFAAPLAHYDALGVPRAHSCLVSSSLFADLEPARELGLPALWMRVYGSLAAHMCTAADACPVEAVESLPGLAMGFLGATGTSVETFIPLGQSKQVLDAPPRQPSSPVETPARLP